MSLWNPLAAGSESRAPAGKHEKLGAIAGAYRKLKKLEIMENLTAVC